MMKPIWKPIGIGLAAIAIPSCILFAQTTPGTTTGTQPYIPLFASSGGTTSVTPGTGTSTTAASVWFIDVAAKTIVACTQGSSTTTITPGMPGAQTINCVTQPIPAATTTTPAPAPAPTTTPTPAPAPAPGGTTP